MLKVYFIGAGPGDPDLITVKGKQIIEKADVIIYAGSLVNPKILDCRKSDAEVHNSAMLTLDEVTKLEIDNIKKGRVVARVHTGDPSIYGAIKEQMDILDQEGIEYEVIPGVSSFLASAAALKKEFTLPGISQTVICTRLSGRTDVPEKESLESLASHKASMAIFLSVQMIDDVVEKLKVHYRGETPVAVVQKATWDDQKIVIGNLNNISQLVKESKITKTAQILVGDFIKCDSYELSKLYDKTFTHEYRKGVDNENSSMVCDEKGCGEL